MSAKQFSLKSPVTIAVVMMLLVGVVFLNVNTFGGSSRKTSRGYRIQAHPPVPMDAGSLVVCQVGWTKPGAQSPLSFSSESLQRDPFFPKNDQPEKAARPTSSRPKTKAVKRPNKKDLACTAIMLGGVRPMAIVNGEGHHPGDKINGMVLTAIDADGVTLRKANGSRVHLPVGVAEDKNQSFRVVTRTKKSDDQGITHLVDQ